MKKIIVLLVWAIVFLYGCIKTNSPISDIQQKMNGTWQVDSATKIYYQYNLLSNNTIQKVRIITDTFFYNHTINFLSNGNIVSVDMQPGGVTKYEIVGNSLTPYVTNNGFIGCGIPFVTNNTITVTDNKLLLLSLNYNGADIDSTFTYMHR